MGGGHGRRKGEEEERKEFFLKKRQTQIKQESHERIIGKTETSRLTQFSRI